MSGEIGRTIMGDENGLDENGLGYTERPTRKAVRAGFVVASPVVLQYPDGRRVGGQEVLVTPKGMEHLHRALGQDTGRRH